MFVIFHWIVLNIATATSRMLIFLHYSRSILFLSPRFNFDLNLNIFNLREAA